MDLSAMIYPCYTYDLSVLWYVSFHAFDTCIADLRLWYAKKIAVICCGEAVCSQQIMGTCIFTRIKRGLHTRLIQVEMMKYSALLSVM